MPNLIQSLVLAACAALSVASFAAPTETLCSDRADLLAKREGVYASKQLVAAAIGTRRWDRALPDAAGISELRISRDGVVTLSFGWHEGGSLGAEFQKGCLTFDGAQVLLKQPQFDKADAFTRLGSATAKDADAPYFNLLFKDCFTDQAGQRWCFTANAVEIAGTSRHARLMLDTVELPAGGTVLEVAGEREFWLFVPRGQGWAVYRTTWASADSYVEPVWSKPWKVLTLAK